MKTLKKTLVLMIMLLSFTLGYAQNDFTITIMENIGYDQVLVRIEHTNSKFVEHLISGRSDDLSVNFVNEVIKDPVSEGYPKDVLQSTIALPSEDLNSTPIEFFNAGSKIYCFGTKQIIVIDSNTGDVISTIHLSNSGSYYARNYLNLLPVNRFITGNTATSILYCADLSNNLYFINMQTDEVFASYSLTDYSDQISTSVVYNDVDDIVYWMVNSWEGSTGTQINAYNGTTGAYISQRFFDQEIMDVMAADGNLFITDDINLTKLNTQTLATIDSYPGRYEKMFWLNCNELAVVKYYYLDSKNRTLVIFDVATTKPLQEFATPYPPLSYNDIVINVQNYSFTLLTMATDGFTDLWFYEKNMSGQYVCTKHDEINYVYAKSLTETPSGNYIFFGGKNYLGRLNLQNFTIDYSDYIDGCYSYDLTTCPDSTNLRVFSANPVEGTYSMHNENCNLVRISQTAFKSNTGCFNPTENKMYFVNNRIDYENSGMAIIDCNTDELITIVVLGKYLTDAVYNTLSNDVFVAGKKSNDVYVIDGNNDVLAHTINLPGSPLHLFSYQDKIFCGTNTAIYIIDVDNNYTYSTLFLPFTDWREKCIEFEMNGDNNRLYALYAEGTKTYNVEIDLGTNSIYQIHEFDFFDGCDIEYNHIDNKVYVANLKLPKFYVYDPATFNLIHTVEYSIPNLFFDLEMEIDYYRNKVYLTYEAASDAHSMTIINCDDYSYETFNVNAAKSSQAFNPVNEQVYHYDIAINDDNKNEIFYGVLDCMDDENMDNVFSGNLINRNYSLHGSFDKIKPVVKTGKNKIYWPNGDFSNISVIKAYTNRLGLQNGWNWISFPRMERYGNEYAPTIPVLERVNYFPELEMTLWDNEDYYKRFESGIWSGPLDDIRSTDGYKLEFDLTDSPAPEIALHGAKIDPATEITIYPNQENWIGYFIENAQYPWDAFPEGLYNSYLTMIKAQYWTMFKISGNWLVTSRVTPIKYGDMVIVTISGQQSYTFTWNNPTESEETNEMPQSEYFNFTEQSDYLPFYIETDSTSDIYEIAVMADGECKGAAVRQPGDTLVEVNAYLQGTPPGTPIEFETWTGYKSTKIGSEDYAVMNHGTGKFEKRLIYKGESAKYHIVSFKAGETAQVPALISDANCSPNPFSNETLITFRITEKTPVQVTIFDLNGNLINNLMGGVLPSGYYKTIWKGDNESGNIMKNGVYIYKITTGNGDEISGKVVLIK